MAGEAGANFLGVIFADSPRRVDVAAARAIFDAVTGAPVQRVGVFGAASADEILRVATTVGLDVLQLHSPALITQIGRIRAGFPGQVWGVVSVVPDGALAGGADWAHWHQAHGVVIDSWSDRALGGTGRSFAWEALRATATEHRARQTLILAGGLRPSNVADAIAALAPDVVDVSSGVEERPGYKNPERVAAFVRAARGATA